MYDFQLATLIIAVALKMGRRRGEARGKSRGCGVGRVGGREGGTKRLDRKIRAPENIPRRKGKSGTFVGSKVIISGDSLL